MGVDAKDYLTFSTTWLIENQLSLPVYVETINATELVTTIVFVFRVAVSLSDVFQDKKWTTDQEEEAVLEEERRSLGQDQLALFHHLEASLSAAGLSGRACLLRAVCEAQSKRLLALNLLGHLLTAFLTPQDKESLSPYWEASSVGQSGTRDGRCKRRYPGCPFSVLDVFKLGRKNRRKNNSEDEKNSSRKKSNENRRRNDGDSENNNSRRKNDDSGVDDNGSDLERSGPTSSSSSSSYDQLPLPPPLPSNVIIY
ncbi:uncharacterized protein LOC126986041 [Eriocheir sinensis]|uniref:uncharacterized protein LOC126986041 n=1 Tax=Eriocheir sinensis TaxID=95602 RepID=UPI0021C7EAD8|nr:uncharacterized protein LOC126986041 [Eriocheir sinensis]